jgi:hypothetical protein
MDLGNFKRGTNMKIVKTANGNSVRISKSEWENIGKKAGWIKEATFDEMFEQWSNNEDKFNDLSTDKLRNLYLWSANDNQWLEQYEGGIDNGFDEEKYLKNLDEMLTELDRRKRLASNDSIVKEAGKHKLPDDFKQMLRELIGQGHIRIRGKIGDNCVFYPNSIDPRTKRKFSPIPFHPKPDVGTLRNVVSRLRKSCPSFTNWPPAYMQGGRCDKKTKKTRKPDFMCDCCGSSNVTRDEDTSPTFIRCQEPSCGHVSFK